jgi:peroxiredoxin family protein
MFQRGQHQHAGATPAVVDPRADRMSIILFSGTVEKLLAASILASGAAMMGMEVEVFLTNYGLLGFRKDDYKTNTRISDDFADYQPMLMEKLQGPNAPNWMENFQRAKEVGDLKVFACGMTMELFGLQQSDLEPIVDEVVGVAGFVERAKESKVTLFI